MKETIFIKEIVIRAFCLIWFKQEIHPSREFYCALEYIPQISNDGAFSCFLLAPTMHSLISMYFLFNSGAIEALSEKSSRGGILYRKITVWENIESRCLCVRLCSYDCTWLAERGKRLYSYWFQRISSPV